MNLRRCFFFSGRCPNRRVFIIVLYDLSLLCRRNLYLAPPLLPTFVLCDCFFDEQTGMRHAYGKPQGTTARVAIGQVRHPPRLVPQFSCFIFPSYCVRLCVERSVCFSFELGDADKYVCIQIVRAECQDKEELNKSHGFPCWMYMAVTMPAHFERF